MAMACRRGGHGLRHGRRNQQLGTGIVVFGLIVIELVAGHDLARDAGLRCMVSQHTHFQFPGLGDCMLDQHGQIVRRRQIEGPGAVVFDPPHG